MPVQFYRTAPSALTIPSVFPLSASADKHTMVDAQGRPFALLGRTCWNIIARPKTGPLGWQVLLDDSVTKNFTMIEMRAACHSGTGGSNQDFNPPFDGSLNLPFLKTLSGATYAGALDAVDSPDYSTPNDAYFDSVISIIDYCAAAGIQVNFFPSYMGFPGTDQGWDKEMQANGGANMQVYGSYVKSRLAGRNNVTLMLLGDQGASLSTPQKTALNGMHTGLSLAGKLVCSEGTSPSISTDQTDYGSLITLNGAYDFDGNTEARCRALYTHSPTLPGILDETWYDMEGPDGDNFNPAAVQPVRRVYWRAIMNCPGGYTAGNAFVWRMQAGWNAFLNTTGAQDMARLNAFWKSIRFDKLVPDGLGSIGTLVTANAGTRDTDTSVSAAAAADGTLLLAYCGLSSGNPTIDMTKMRGTTTANWFDPTNGTYTLISSSLANTGTHAFTKLGNNSAGEGDWVLVLTA